MITRPYYGLVILVLQIMSKDMKAFKRLLIHSKAELNIVNYRMQIWQD